ncbi:ribosome maturation factor RimM [Prevotella cerevisiae]|uniref:Ribosome maturation factor RimM n=1 Tax=Segatella cerevisiae TaxID=2053716 RepID=A0ABT1BW06_9BACT|nr:ribosome maturation factor RimM [Segatella cerevisiae]MCO6025266.1 ribosome maturation factor RimM [Segatella cerevisiae]
MMKEDEVFYIGRLGKHHGVKGEINFFYEDDVFDQVQADYLILKMEGILVPFYLESYRFQNEGTAYVKFEDIDTVDQACELTGCEVFFPKSLAEETDGPRLGAELVNYQLTDAQSGKVIGTIKGIDDSTANLLFQVETAEGNSILIPASENLINNINTEGHIIEMNLPDGLLDL